MKRVLELNSPSYQCKNLEDVLHSARNILNMQETALLEEVVRYLKYEEQTIETLRQEDKAVHAVAPSAQKKGTQHLIKFDGTDNHKGEDWYKCAVCGAHDWIASYGTEEQLNFYNKPCPGKKP